MADISLVESHTITYPTCVLCGEILYVGEDQYESGIIQILNTDGKKYEELTVRCIPSTDDIVKGGTYVCGTERCFSYALKRIME